MFCKLFWSRDALKNIASLTYDMCIWNCDILMLCFLVNMDVYVGMYGYVIANALKILLVGSGSSGEGGSSWLFHLLWNNLTSQSSSQDAIIGASFMWRLFAILRKWLGAAVMIAANLLFISQRDFLYHNQGTQIVHEEKEYELCLYLILVAIGHIIFTYSGSSSKQEKQPLEGMADFNWISDPQKLMTMFAQLIPMGLLAWKRHDTGLTTFKFMVDVSGILTLISTALWTIVLLFNISSPTTVTDVKKKQ